MSPAKKLPAEQVHAAVRRDKVTGEDFVDLGSVAHTREGAELRARDTGSNAAWRTANPTVRFGVFRLEEVPR